MTMRKSREIEYESQGFTKRLTSMLGVDLRRMFGTSQFYIMLGIALVIPILVLVMTSGFGGGESMGFTNTWQIIASDSSAGMMAMDGSAMMNINLMYGPKRTTMLSQRH